MFKLKALLSFFLLYQNLKPGWCFQARRVSLHPPHLVGEVPHAEEQQDGVNGSGRASDARGDRRGGGCDEVTEQTDRKEPSPRVGVQQGRRRRGHALRPGARNNKTATTFTCRSRGERDQR